MAPERGKQRRRNAATRPGRPHSTAHRARRATGPTQKRRGRVHRGGWTRPERGAGWERAAPRAPLGHWLRASGVPDREAGRTRFESRCMRRHRDRQRRGLPRCGRTSLPRRSPEGGQTPRRSPEGGLHVRPKALGGLGGACLSSRGARGFIPRAERGGLGGPSRPPKSNSHNRTIAVRTIQPNGLVFESQVDLMARAILLCSI
jgi:hypothetical protein